MVDLEPSFYNRTVRRDDKWAGGHETALWLVESTSWNPASLCIRFHSISQTI